MSNQINSGNDVEIREPDENIYARQPWKPSRHQMVVIVTLSIMSFVIALDATVIVTSLSVKSHSSGSWYLEGKKRLTNTLNQSVIQDIGGTSTQAFWVGTAYLISCATVMPLLASLSEIFGRPVILIGSLMIFTTGTTLCCVAESIGPLLGGRVVQGIGAGGMPKYYGIIQLAWAVGSLVGPVIGGAIAEHTTWRWIFYINFPICAYSLIAVPVLLTLKPPTRTFAEKLQLVDWLGGFLFIGSMVTFLVGLSWGGNDFPWRSAQTLVPVFIGAAGLMTTLFYEHRFAKVPFLKRTLFTDMSSITV
ncbi:major facilitator superfamily transporter, partial [Colletotrichum acutatum]